MLSKISISNKYKKEIFSSVSIQSKQFFLQLLRTELQEIKTAKEKVFIISNNKFLKY